VLIKTRDLKDSLVVTSCGAESISFLKFYGVLPASAVFLVGYSRMSNSLSPQMLWYATALPFFVFFLAFDQLIYPIREALQPTIPLKVHLPAARCCFEPPAAVTQHAATRPKVHPPIPSVLLIDIPIRGPRVGCQIVPKLAFGSVLCDC